MSAKTITSDDFHHIAKLSRLILKPEDEVIAAQLSQAADYTNILNKLDTSQTPPTFQVNHKKNIFRTDSITKSLPIDLALSQAVKTSNGYFVTAATIPAKGGSASGGKK